MEMVDSRRITGPSLLADAAGAILDVSVPNERQSEVVAAWERAVRRVLSAVGWGDETTAVRRFDGGLSLFMSAPVDALYAATEVNEDAWTAVLSTLNGEKNSPADAEVERLQKLISEETNSGLLSLKTAAAAHHVRFLQDDNCVSIGTGKGSTVYPVHDIPDPREIDWDSVYDIPTVLITGTNGKSTSVRLLEAVIECSGFVSGAASTDGVRVAGQTVEKGDYSGPEGARAVLRNHDVEVAALEVARGGLLRRGVPIKGANAAVITNVAEDHLGEYGIYSLAELVQAKFVIRKALADDGILVLNADDSGIVEYSKGISQAVCWFTLDESNPVVRQHIGAGGVACFLEGVQIVYAASCGIEQIMNIEDIPITMKGAARYNIVNCLNAISLAKMLNLSNSTIRDALSRFGGSFRENPGRGNFIHIDGVTVLMDFAHNPHGMKAIIEMVRQVPARRRLILVGQAGDRSNGDIRALVEATAILEFDRVIVAEIPKYLRGRESGEVPDLIRSAFEELGIGRDDVELSPDCLSGVRSALEWSQSGDLLLLLVLDQKEEVFEFIRSCETS